MKGTAIELSMNEYEDYLVSRGLSLAHWTLDSIALAIESGVHSDRVIALLEAMKNTTWADEFDELHGVIDVEYGPQLADLFNIYNMVNLLKFRGVDISNGYVCRAHRGSD
jgi:hypothetical protein